jgi:hypothetical protein
MLSYKFQDSCALVLFVTFVLQSFLKIYFIFLKLISLRSPTSIDANRERGGGGLPLRDFGKL